MRGKIRNERMIYARYCAAGNVKEDSIPLCRSAQACSSEANAASLEHTMLLYQYHKNCQHLSSDVNIPYALGAQFASAPNCSMIVVIEPTLSMIRPDQVTPAGEVGTSYFLVSNSCS
jgi:hypothetical protein